ncbi:MAG: monofunctional biosynthetic peptidoglycan transglycosylase [Candidatus Binatia bacterium]
MRRLVFLLLRAVFGAFAAAALLVAIFSVVPLPTTAFMIRSAAVRGQMVDYDWTAGDKISPHLLVAVVAAEDQRFDEHSGFDFEAIEKAVAHNTRGGSVRGASTISQQVAKNIFLWPGRSYVRKGLEAALTAMIELTWTKRRILDVYVNVAEFGDGVFGAEAAARRFFDKPAAALTAPESALLAAVLPNPGEYNAAKPSSYVKRRQQWILRQMRSLGGESWLERLDQ